MFDFFKSQPQPDGLAFAVPSRLDADATLRFLVDGIGLAREVFEQAHAIRDAAEKRGYTHVQTMKMSPVQLSESFVHAREEQRLILNSHSYPGCLRQMLSLHIPGGVGIEALDGVRERAGLLGETHDRGGHLYGDWRTGDEAAPCCIEVNQDAFEGVPFLLRVVFHRTRMTD